MFRCPKCGSGWARELERTWVNNKTYMQRKYQCDDCEYIFWTYEILEDTVRQFLNPEKFVRPTPEEIIEKVMKRNIEEYKRTHKKEFKNG